MDFRELTATDRDAAAGIWEEVELSCPWNCPCRDFDRAVLGPTSTVLGAPNERGLAATVLVGDDGHAVRVLL